MQVPEPGAVQEMPPLLRVERLSAMGRLLLVEPQSLGDRLAG
jgi:hypothetical protein